ncbi:hypothetical protein [Mucilaginibacter flavus]|uniref:hypothetical protein n=1 Tax=Mucilaginibacter flavus TaxID=931504 RepID=UPI0025B3E2F2|nr:hypothetical protein [Mucilaginibacter flavus]MDN3583946.1 hypothetical protein [Mucilaginibacter flavus]
MKHVFESVIVPASVLIPIGAGLIKIVYKYPFAKPILIYLLFAGITDVVERILGLRHINNLPLLHFYTIVEYLFILKFFQSFVSDFRVLRVIWILFILFPFLSVLDFIFIQDIHEYNSYPRPIAALIVIGLCMYYFFNYTTQENKKPWVTMPINWIVTGLLIYFSSSLIYFAFLNLIAQQASDNLYFIFGGIHATLVLLMYLMVAVGFLQIKNEG